jgi:hypothetical protein
LNGMIYSGIYAVHPSGPRHLHWCLFDRWLSTLKHFCRGGHPSSTAGPPVQMTRSRDFGLPIEGETHIESKIVEIWTETKDISVQDQGHLWNQNWRIEISADLSGKSDHCLTGFDGL